ncbi:hypothetical protein C8R46DRAFT_1216985 [Mycena filopes]|nr:hypothetical protein C8R46DRAFT_1216985 [Mycena filopes]
MDSQLTLVTPAPATHLLFSRDSMKNATLLLNGTPAYTIATDADGSCTELRTANTSLVVTAGANTAEVLARIRRRALRPDTIAFPRTEDKEMAISKWLKKSRNADGSSFHVLKTVEGDTLVLRKHAVHRLAMFPAEEDEPIAYWHRASPILPPTLVMRAGVAARPQIIAAFVVREFQMRMKEKARAVMERPAM